MTSEALRSLVDLRDRTLQKARIAFGNRVDALIREADTADPATEELFARWYKRFNDLEDEADKDIAKLVSDWPIVEDMICIRGVGKLLAAKFVSMVDISRADTVSALWRYCGYGVVLKIKCLSCGHESNRYNLGDDYSMLCEACGRAGLSIDGQREKYVSGERAHFNGRLKTTCYLIGSSFLKTNSPYRAIYDEKRIYYARREDWTKAHQHNAAMRKMIKVWISHVWARWRTLEGLPIRPLYVHEYLNHSMIYKPEDFGWPELKNGR